MENIGVLELEGMEFHAYHGCLESEKTEGNLFTVDFRGSADFSKAAESDRLEDTVNYAGIHELVSREMSIPSDLIENVAGRIVHSISMEFPQFIEFSVRVSKRRPPVGGKTEWSRITLYSRKSHE